MLLCNGQRMEGKRKERKKGKVEGERVKHATNSAVTVKVCMNQDRNTERRGERKFMTQLWHFFYDFYLKTKAVFAVCRYHHRYRKERSFFLWPPFEGCIRSMPVVVVAVAGMVSVSEK